MGGASRQTQIGRGMTLANAISEGLDPCCPWGEVAEASPLARALAWAFAPGRFAAFVAALAALAFAEEWLWDGAVWRDHPALFAFPDVDVSAWHALIVPQLALPQATHYDLDRYLWRLDGSNPGLAEALAIAAR